MSNKSFWNRHDGEVTSLLALEVLDLRDNHIQYIALNAFKYLPDNVQLWADKWVLTYKESRTQCRQVRGQKHHKK